MVSFLVGGDRRIIAATRYAAECLGYGAEELIGRNLLDLHPRSERDRIDQELLACLAQPGEMRRWSGSNHGRDGCCLHLDITARGCLDAAGVPRLMVVGSDASATRALAERLTRSQSHDALTGLPNRGAFEARLEECIAHGGEHAVLWFDVDQFEVLNQTLGTRAGDELLRALATVLRKRLRHGDLLARMGGDSFAALIDSCGAAQALRVTRLVEAEIDDFRFHWADGPRRVRMSIGVVAFQARESSTAEVLRAASAACHLVKEGGASGVHVYDGDDAGLSGRQREMQWVARIESALDESRFALCLQPIRAAADDVGANARYEVLLRMVERDGTLIAPGAFLPAAERYHLAGRIDRWVVRSVLDWLGSDRDALAELQMCFVNLSALSIGDDEFLATVIAELEASGVPGEKLCFEVTETAAIANLAKAGRFCSSLRALGCCFAIDDFGSGVSSFAYLRALPVDFIKIDGMFVRDLVNDPVAFATVRSINEIGQLMGMQTIAEFVEDQPILDRVREIGLDYVQGYRVGRPVRLVA